MDSEIPEDYGGVTVNNEAEKNILSTLDFDQIFDDILHKIRRHELEIVKGKRTWIPPDKTPVYEMQGEGVNAKLVQTGTTVATPPIVNKHGENDLMALLTAFLNKNIILTNFPADKKKGGDKEQMIMKTCKGVGEKLIDMLFTNYTYYEIQKPDDIGLMYWIIMINVEAALRQALGSGGRHFITAGLQETKQIIERVERNED